MVVSLDERVNVLERKVASLEGRADRSEPMLETTRADVATIPELIRIETRLIDSRLAQMRSDSDRFRAEMKKDMQEFKTEMNDRFDAVIRAISEIVTERRRGP